MDIDTSRFMSSQAAEYLRRAKECSEAADRTTDPENASHGGRRSDGRRAFCSIERIDTAETGRPKPRCVTTAEHRQDLGTHLYPQKMDDDDIPEPGFATAWARARGEEGARRACGPPS